jgi:hypothetical protein
MVEQALLTLAWRTSFLEQPELLCRIATLKRRHLLTVALALALLKQFLEC